MTIHFMVFKHAHTRGLQVLLDTWVQSLPGRISQLQLYN